MAVTRIWLVRHAESAVPDVFHGAESDIGLSEHGQRQAELAAEWFTALAPDLVLSSVMLRARRTAEPIAHRCQVEHRQASDLHERRVGELSGTRFDTGTGPWVETVERWQAGDLHYTTPGAESFAELQERLLPAWQRVAEEYSGKKLVLVAHGIVCKVLLLSLLPGWGPTRWKELGRVPNLSVSALWQETGGPWQAEWLLQVPEPVQKWDIERTSQMKNR